MQYSTANDFSLQAPHLQQCCTACLYTCLAPPGQNRPLTLRADTCNVATDLQAMKASKHMGAVAQRCCAVVSVALGGQILCDSATLEGIRVQLADLYKGCIRSDAQRTSAPSMRP